MNQNPMVIEDARFITDYVPNGMLEKNIQSYLHIETNADYRKHLTNNARKIMNVNQQAGLRYNVEMKFNVVSDTKQGPYLYRSIQDNIVPQGYETNETKQMYLSRVQLNDLKFNQYKKMNI